MPEDLPQVHYSLRRGPNWRKVKPDPLLDKDDDEELAETPPDVIAMLGFDPKQD